MGVRDCDDLSRLFVYRVPRTREGCLVSVTERVPRDTARFAPFVASTVYEEFVRPVVEGTRRAYRRRRADDTAPVLPSTETDAVVIGDTACFVPCLVLTDGLDSITSELVRRLVVQESNPRIRLFVFEDGFLLHCIDDCTFDTFRFVGFDV
jgi:hypothetical protein